jgi:hypothetical protein
MTEEIAAILDRLERDVALLRGLVGKPATKSTARSPASHAKNDHVTIPELKESYTKREAKQEKLRIEDAFRARLISYDKKRGMKMLVTKATEGWFPVK